MSMALTMCFDKVGVNVHFIIFVAVGVLHCQE